jgi:acyl-CoA reductase-like NAD-dependent aldehyde dehydrogenase
MTAPVTWTDDVVSVFDEVGAPSGIFNLVHGLGGEAGDAMVRVSGVPGTKFTAQAGKLRMAAATIPNRSSLLSLISILHTSCRRVCGGGRRSRSIMLR